MKDSNAAEEFYKMAMKQLKEKSNQIKLLQRKCLALKITNEGLKTQTSCEDCVKLQVFSYYNVNHRKERIPSHLELYVTIWAIG
jgi:hypothetical protein